MEIESREDECIQGVAIGQEPCSMCQTCCDFHRLRVSALERIRSKIIAAACLRDDISDEDLVEAIRKLAGQPSKPIAIDPVGDAAADALNKILQRDGAEALGKLVEAPEREQTDWGGRGRQPGATRRWRERNP